MSDSFEYFFRSPDLILHLVTFLDDQDLINFTQTNSFLHHFSKENPHTQIKLMKVKLRMQEEYIKTVKQNPLVLLEIQKKKQQTHFQEQIQNHVFSSRAYLPLHIPYLQKTQKKKSIPKAKIQKKEVEPKVKDEFNEQYLSPLDRIFVKQLSFMNEVNKPRRKKSPALKKYIPPVDAYLKVYYAEHIDPYLDEAEYEHHLTQVYDYKDCMREQLHKTMQSIDRNTVLPQETIRRFCPMSLLRKISSSLNLSSQ